MGFWNTFLFRMRSKNKNSRNIAVLQIFKPTKKIRLGIESPPEFSCDLSSCLSVLLLLLLPPVRTSWKNSLSPNIKMTLISFKITVSSRSSVYGGLVTPGGSFENRTLCAALDFRHDLHM